MFAWSISRYRRHYRIANHTGWSSSSRHCGEHFEKSGECFGSATSCCKGYRDILQIVLSVPAVRSCSVLLVMDTRRCKTPHIVRGQFGTCGCRKRYRTSCSTCQEATNATHTSWRRRRGAKDIIFLGAFHQRGCLNQPYCRYTGHVPGIYHGIQ